jgi:hypothetical protein
MKKFSVLFNLCFLFLLGINGFAQKPPTVKDEMLKTPKDNANDKETNMGAVIMKPTPALLQIACAERKKMGGLVKVYEICAHSPEGHIHDWEQHIAEKKSTFMLALDFTYNVGGPRAAEAFAENLPQKNQMSSEAAQQQEAFLNFIKALDVKKTTRLEIHFNPNPQGVGVEAMFFPAGEEAKVFDSENVEFSKALAGIWLGKNPVDEKIKAALLK